MIFCAAMLVFGLMACKNGNVNSLEADTTPQSDTISYDSDTLKEVKQYDSEGRRTGSWTYEGFRLDYRAYIKEYLDDGKTVRFEGVGYYGDNGSLLAEGYWCVGRWKIYDTKSKTVKTVTFKKPNCEIESYVYSLGI